MMILTAFPLFLKELINQLKKDPIFDWAATLAFYFMLSIFPLIIFILALLPYLPINMEQLYSFVNDYVPTELANLISTTIFEVVQVPQSGLISFGILATVWSASNGINALIRALNRAHNLEETRSFVKIRFMSIVMTLGMVFVFVITLLLPVFGHLILKGIDFLFFLPETVFHYLNNLRWAIGIIVMTSVITFIYSIAPNKRMQFGEVIVGAIFATISWQLISFAFSIYITHFGNYSATYGSLGGVIILMVWFFLSGLILVIGGEINATFEKLKEEGKMKKT